MSARSCKIASAPSSLQNFSAPLTRWLICFISDSMGLLVIGNPRSWNMGNLVMESTRGPRSLANRVVHPAKVGVANFSGGDVGDWVNQGNRFLYPGTRMFYEYDGLDRSGRPARGAGTAGLGSGGGDGAVGPDGSRRDRLRRLRRSGPRERTRATNPDAWRRGGSTHRGRRKKGAPLRACVCGRQKENRGPKERRLMSAVGAVAFRRRYWKCTCGTDGSYAADELLGVAGQRYTKTVQKHCCRLAAEVSFAAASELLHELSG